MKRLLLTAVLALANIHPSPAQRLSGSTTQAAAAPGGGGTPAPLEYEAPITGFADAINLVFQSVDKSRVASGILEEYGLQFIDHTPFTGTNGFTVANQVDINRWRALYGDLYGARINENSAAMMSLAGVNIRLKLSAFEPSVELPILHFDYHSIRTDALSSGRIQSVSNRLYDVAGQDPYQLNTAFAVAAASTDLPSATPSFIFRSNLFWTNTGRTVATLQADFADGNGFVTMNWDVSRPVSYATGGPKDVRVRVSYTDGSTFESHVLAVSPEPVPQARYSGVANQTFVLTADKSYNGIAASANISVEYGGRNKPTPDPAVLDKPLIIVKGFDVSGFIGGPDTRSTYERFIVRQLNQTQGVVLSDGADLDGYDIVYVDFNNGTDYIQRNAFLLERVIRWVNEQKAAANSTQPNAMIAMSMGGLVAQYALRDIEVAGSVANNSAYPHQVNLLITHDSPHQGANVPLSLQMTVRHLAGTVIRNPIGSDITLVDRYPLLGQAREALLSPAAQQMLRYQTKRGVVTFGGVQFAGPVEAAQTSLYDTFQQEYQALLGPAKVPVGTPGRPCRVVASSNGSECGRGQPYGPYAELARISYNDNIANFPLLNGFLATGTIFAGAGAVLGAGLLTGPGVIIAAGALSIFALGMTGAYDLTAEYRLNALPDQQRQQIYSIFAQVNKRTRLFGLFRVQYTLLDFQGYSLASQLPLDSGSGGVVSLATYGQQVAGSTTALPPGIIKQQQFCFLPTYSGLNITPTSSAALRASYSPGTSVGTPFANFRTAARENEQHLEYTALNSSWMLQELRQTPQVLSCAAFCQANPGITGSAVVCPGSNTYSINAPAGTTVSWDAQPPGQVAIVGPATGTAITITPLTSGNQIVRLTATILSDCGSFAIGLGPLAVGQGNITLTPADPAMGLHSSTNISASSLGINTLLSNKSAWTATLSTQNGTISIPFSMRGLGATSIRTAIIEEDGTLTVTCTGQDVCGQSVTGAINIPVGLGQRPAPTAALYPNPATSTVAVRVDNADAAHPVTVRLFDGHGQPRAEQTSTGATSLQFSTAQLPAGLYFVHILRGRQVLSRQQLRIEK